MDCQRPASSWFASLDQDSKKTLICLLFEVRARLEKDGDLRHDLYLQFIRHLDAEYHALKMSPRERARESWRDWDAAEVAREVVPWASNECDPEVYANGELICVLDACMYRAEHWVRAVAQESGQKVDWHYVGGRAVVKFVGDRKKVSSAVQRLEPDLALTPVKATAHHCRCSGPKHDACRMMRGCVPGT